MASLDLGAKATVRWPTAPETGPYALAVKKPDGTTLDPAPLVTGFRESTQAEFVPAMAGRYLLSWTAGGAGAYTDVLDVWPQDPQFLISLEEAVAGLKFAANADPAKSLDLRLYVAAATPVIEDIVGPMVATTRTFETWGGTPTVILPHLPNQIISIMAGDVPVLDYVTEYGILYSGSRSMVTAFPSGELVITYRTGNAEIPPNIRLATREVVRYWWQGGMQGSGSGGNIRSQQADSDAFTPSGYAVPRRVIELCAPHQQMGGLA